MYFWYVVFKVDRAHPHLLPARRFKTLMHLETREAILSTWVFQFNFEVIISTAHFTVFQLRYLERTQIFIVGYCQLIIGLGLEVAIVAYYLILDPVRQTAGVRRFPYKPLI